MNPGIIFCLFMIALFGVMSVLFTVLGEKGAMLISGFNTLPQEVREQYDRKRMSMDQRNSFLIWTVIFIIGAVSSYFIGQYCSIAAGIIWLVLLLKNVRLDVGKAFQKYKI